jgi:hypothetical protein
MSGPGYRTTAPATPNAGAGSVGQQSGSWRQQPQSHHHSNQQSYEDLVARRNQQQQEYWGSALDVLDSALAASRASHSGSSRLLYMDTMNFATDFIPIDDWSMRKAQKRVREFVNAATNSGFKVSAITLLSPNY